MKLFFFSFSLLFNINLQARDKSKPQAIDLSKEGFRDGIDLPKKGQRCWSYLAPYSDDPNHRAISVCVVEIDGVEILPRSKVESDFVRCQNRCPEERYLPLPKKDNTPPPEPPASCPSPTISVDHHEPALRYLNQNMGQVQTKVQPPSTTNHCLEQCSEAFQNIPETDRAQCDQFNTHFEEQKKLYSDKNINMSDKLLATTLDQAILTWEPEKGSNPAEACLSSAQDFIKSNLKSIIELPLTLTKLNFAASDFIACLIKNQLESPTRKAEMCTGLINFSHIGISFMSNEMRKFRCLNPSGRMKYACRAKFEAIAAALALEGASSGVARVAARMSANAERLALARSLLRAEREMQLAQRAASEAKKTLEALQKVAQKTAAEMQSLGDQAAEIVAAEKRLAEATKKAAEATKAMGPIPKPLPCNFPLFLPKNPCIVDWNGH